MNEQIYRLTSKLKSKHFITFSAYKKMQVNNVSQKPRFFKCLVLHQQYQNFGNNDAYTMNLDFDDL